MLQDNILKANSDRSFAAWAPGVWTAEGRCPKGSTNAQTNSYVPESNGRAQAGKAATVMWSGECLEPWSEGRRGRASPEEGEGLLPAWEAAMAWLWRWGDTLGTELVLTKAKCGNSEGGLWWAARPWVYWLKQLHKRSCKTITPQSILDAPSWHMLSVWLTYTHKNSLQIWLFLTSTRLSFEERSPGRSAKAPRSREIPQGCRGS